MNQYSLSKDKQYLIYHLLFMQYKTQKQCAKELRLSPNTIKYYVKLWGLANQTNLRNSWYIKNVWTKVKRRHNEEIN